MIKYILLSFLILVYSCKRAAPSQVLDEKKMQQVLWDVYRADALSKNLSKNDSVRSVNTNANDLIQKVFKIHHISANQFKASYTYYTNHPVILKRMLDSIYAVQIKREVLPIPARNKKFFKNTLHK